eukprot:jgi/Chrzof1/7955/UNPLg00015.t1
MFCFVALLTDAVLVYPDIVLGQAQDQLLKYLVSLSPEERADVMDVSGDGEWGQPILQHLNNHPHDAHELALEDSPEEGKIIDFGYDLLLVCQGFDATARAKWADVETLVGILNEVSECTAFSSEICKDLSSKVSPRVFIARFDLERRVEACAALAVVIEMHLWAAHFKAREAESKFNFEQLLMEEARKSWIAEMSGTTEKKEKEKKSGKKKKAKGATAKKQPLTQHAGGSGFSSSSDDGDHGDHDGSLLVNTRSHSKAAANAPSQQQQQQQQQQPHKIKLPQSEASHGHLQTPQHQLQQSGAADMADVAAETSVSKPDPVPAAVLDGDSLPRSGDSTQQGVPPCLPTSWPDDADAMDDKGIQASTRKHETAADSSVLQAASAPHVASKAVVVEGRDGMTVSNNQSSVEGTYSPVKNVGGSVASRKLRPAAAGNGYRHDNVMHQRQQQPSTPAGVSHHDGRVPPATRSPLCGGLTAAAAIRAIIKDGPSKSRARPAVDAHGMKDEAEANSAGRQLDQLHAHRNSSTSVVAAATSNQEVAAPPAASPTAAPAAIAGSKPDTNARSAGHVQADSAHAHGKPLQQVKPPVKQEQQAHTRQRSPQHSFAARISQQPQQQQQQQAELGRNQQQHQLSTALPHKQQQSTVGTNVLEPSLRSQADVKATSAATGAAVSSQLPGKPSPASSLSSLPDSERGAAKTNAVARSDGSRTTPPFLAAVVGTNAASAGVNQTATRSSKAHRRRSSGSGGSFGQETVWQAVKLAAPAVAKTALVAEAADIAVVADSAIGPAAHHQAAAEGSVVPPSISAVADMTNTSTPAPQTRTASHDSPSVTEPAEFSPVENHDHQTESASKPAGAAADGEHVDYSSSSGCVATPLGVLTQPAGMVANAGEAGQYGDQQASLHAASYPDVGCHPPAMVPVNPISGAEYSAATPPMMSLAMGVPPAGIMFPPDYLPHMFFHQQQQMYLAYLQQQQQQLQVQQADAGMHAPSQLFAAEVTPAGGTAAVAPPDALQQPSQAVLQQPLSFAAAAAADGVYPSKESEVTGLTDGAQQVTTTSTHAEHLTKQLHMICSEQALSDAIPPATAGLSSTEALAEAVAMTPSMESPATADPQAMQAAALAWQQQQYQQHQQYYEHQQQLMQQYWYMQMLQHSYAQAAHHQQQQQQHLPADVSATAISAALDSAGRQPQPDSHVSTVPTLQFGDFPEDFALSPTSAAAATAVAMHPGGECSQHERVMDSVGDSGPTAAHADLHAGAAVPVLHPHASAASALTHQLQQHQLQPQHHTVLGLAKPVQDGAAIQLPAAVADTNVPPLSTQHSLPEDTFLQNSIDTQHSGISTFSTSRSSSSGLSCEPVADSFLVMLGAALAANKELQSSTSKQLRGHHGPSAQRYSGRRGSITGWGLNQPLIPGVALSKFDAAAGLAELRRRSAAVQHAAHMNIDSVQPSMESVSDAVGATGSSHT